jgi:hypothetical protein
MIHYTCDRCRRTIDPRSEIRYTVSIEVAVACAEPCRDLPSEEDDVEGLDELDAIVAGLDEGGDADNLELTARMYDLCSCCHARFVADPLGAGSAAGVGFSDN